MENNLLVNVYYSRALSCILNKRNSFSNWLTETKFQIFHLNEYSYVIFKLQNNWMHLYKFHYIEILVLNYFFHMFMHVSQYNIVIFYFNY